MRLYSDNYMYILINTARYPLAERKYLQKSAFETVLFHEINIASVFSEFIGHNQIVVARSAHHAHISEFAQMMNDVSKWNLHLSWNVNFHGFSRLISFYMFLII